MATEEAVLRQMALFERTAAAKLEVLFKLNLSLVRNEDNSYYDKTTSMLFVAWLLGGGV